ncbi:unnamed protein product [Cylicocyclus nassatus]|uniref:MnmE helical domain-containing protein n=1 Tax=Cylicocyclus nassatus TaxID=53992 RepID=A0AA36GN70_CYLNA|nr:unnamed protein product [Cylicocyclus nassatus]
MPEKLTRKQGLFSRSSRYASTDSSLPVILVRNKANLAGTAGSSVLKPNSRLDIVDSVSTCALSTKGVRPLMDSLKQVVENLCPDDGGPCLTDTELLSEAREELENAAAVHDAALLCDHRERALDIFRQMAGSTVSEEILDKLFSQFCVGK